MLWKGKQILLHMWHPSCFSFKTNNKSHSVMSQKKKVIGIIYKNQAFLIRVSFFQVIICHKTLDTQSCGTYWQRYLLWKMAFHEIDSHFLLWIANDKKRWSFRFSYYTIATLKPLTSGNFKSIKKILEREQ